MPNQNIQTLAAENKRLAKLLVEQQKANESLKSEVVELECRLQLVKQLGASATLKEKTMVDANHYLDHLETTSHQMQQLWALFSQIQRNLQNGRDFSTISTTRKLAEIGNYLSDTWNCDHEGDYEKLKNAMEGLDNE